MRHAMQIRLPHVSAARKLSEHACTTVIAERHLQLAGHSERTILRSPTGVSDAASLARMWLPVERLTAFIEERCADCQERQKQRQKAGQH